MTVSPDTTTQIRKNKLNISNLLDLKGRANNFATENDSMTVMLYSQENELFETAPLDLDSTFEFKNISIKNNSDIYLTLLHKNGQALHADFFFSIQPIKTKYRYVFSLNKSQESAITLTPMELPVVSTPEEIKLDEVEVVENKLRYRKFFGDFYGQKIDSSMLNLSTLGNYIRSFGYKMKMVPVTRNPMADSKREGSLQLLKEKWDALRQNPVIVYPQLVFNGVHTIYAMDFAEVRMEEIDEIYYQNRAAVGQRIFDGGIFVVFTNNKYYNRPSPSEKKTSKKFTINKGYDRSGNFVRPTYMSFEDIGYKNWGVVGWFPQLKPDENGIITFKIPADGQQKLNLQLVGTTMEGELFKQNIVQSVPN